GVHFSVGVDGSVKIGPTAIPAFWRENYHGLSGFSLQDFIEVVGREGEMLVRNGNFRALAWAEMRKYWRPYMATQAAKMVKHIDTRYFSQWMRPGIRAQLIDKQSLQLLHDFVVEGDDKSVHVLNAVSPAFTSSLAFAQWIVEQYCP